jgi:hypothetical protein
MQWATKLGATMWQRAGRMPTSGTYLRPNRRGEFRREAKGRKRKGACKKKVKVSQSGTPKKKPIFKLMEDPRAATLQPATAALPLATAAAADERMLEVAVVLPHADQRVCVSVRRSDDLAALRRCVAEALGGHVMPEDLRLVHAGRLVTPGTPGTVCDVIGKVRRPRHGFPPLAPSQYGAVAGEFRLRLRCCCCSSLVSTKTEQVNHRALCPRPNQTLRYPYPLPRGHSNPWSCCC